MNIWDDPPHNSSDWNYTLERAERIGRESTKIVFAAFCAGVIVGVVLTVSIIVSSGVQ